MLGPRQYIQSNLATHAMLSSESFHAIIAAMCNPSVRFLLTAASSGGMTVEMSDKQTALREKLVSTTMANRALAWSRAILWRGVCWG